MLHTANSSCSLAEAGLTAYQRALKESLPLARIAEQSQRPQLWFAKHILEIIGADAKAPGRPGVVHLSRETTSGLNLADEMTALQAPNEAQPRYVELQIRRADIEKYLEWARTVF